MPWLSAVWAIARHVPPSSLADDECPNAYNAADERNSEFADAPQRRGGTLTRCLVRCHRRRPLLILLTPDASSVPSRAMGVQPSRLGSELVFT